MRTGIYVGSFDPIHKGHIYLAKQLLARKIVDQIVMIVTGNYWQKTLGAEINDRLAMLDLFQSDRIIIDHVNNNQQYTYQILDKIKIQHPDWQLSLIIGDDLIGKFDKWQRLDRLLTYQIIVINRLDIDVDYFVKKYDQQQQFMIIKDLDKFNASSTKIRQLIKDDVNSEELKNYLDVKVIEYITKHHLYQ